MDTEGGDKGAMAPPPAPVVGLLRAEAAAPMERSLTAAMRAEREDLKEAAEQTLNVIMDLGLTGSVRWVSQSWSDVVGTKPEDITGLPIREIVLDDDKDIFVQAIESMQKDDTRSQIVRFTVALGPSSQLAQNLDVDTEEMAADVIRDENHYRYGTLALEAQGIMVYDRSSGGESHTMWMIRPCPPPREIKIDMPSIIIEGLGSGAEILASYLIQLAESGLEDPEHHAPPTPVLCRICERQIPPWFFEKHTELCLQEHQAEMQYGICHDNLTEHRHAIVRVLDALEARKSRSITVADLSSNPPLAEYKGLPIGPSGSTGTSSGSGSPVATTQRMPRDPSQSKGGNHVRARSFAIRRPQAKIVELLLDLCDTALEINRPETKEVPGGQPGEFRTQSPVSEARIAEVMNFQSPGKNTQEQEQGLALLCADTEVAAKAKVDAVLRYRRILEYSERIRTEFTLIVQDCIDEAIRKASRIAAGLDTDSSHGDIDDQGDPQDEAFFAGSFDGPSTLAAALRAAENRGYENSDVANSQAVSTGSNSPQCVTPRSHAGTLSMLTQGQHSSRASERTSRRGSLHFESGNEDSDAGSVGGSLRSTSVLGWPARVDSPVSEFGDLRRQASSRQRDRRSMILPVPGRESPQRQESPSRSGILSSSPLRISKPRLAAFEQQAGIRSPVTSPLLSHHEFTSPSISAHHHRRQSSTTGSVPPPSPRLAAIAAPQARPVPPSIKDFEIVKPISKGAFGSVYLSKKKSTGDYFAIKVLKKADMVAKNQVTNVKAERAIMMWQGESDFVAKLYWTFSSKDYLYLVMEYLNGGDCASLVKVLGNLPEDWAKKYLGEVILGVEHLHSRGIVHRDLKPDNLLIDQKGHLKLTDFGLSRMGLIGRQKRVLNSVEKDQAPDLLKSGPFARSSSMASSRSTSFDFQHGQSPASTPIVTPDIVGGYGQPSYFSLNREASTGFGRENSLNREHTQSAAGHRSDSGGSESLTSMFNRFSLQDPGSQQISPGKVDTDDDDRHSPEIFQLTQVNSHTSMDPRHTPPTASGMLPPPMALFDPDDSNRRFVGTPDYLAPETVRGEGQDEKSDWWSVGCIMFEFLYGYPPFHGSTPDAVFENILARNIFWPDDEEVEISDEAKDLINKLLCMEPSKRLGANAEEKFASGGEEIRQHPWFADTNWDTLLQDEAQFVPQPENLEDTEYFDTRGATLQSFAEEMEDQLSPNPAAGPDAPERPHDALSRVRTQVNNIKRGLMPLHIPPHVRDLKTRRLSEPVIADDFGNFTFKNLPVLEKANKDVIQKLRAEALAAQSKSVHGSPVSSAPNSAFVSPSAGPPSLENSPMIPMPLKRAKSNAMNRPSSPAGFSQANSSPSRQSQPSSPLLVSFSSGGHNGEGRRKTSSNSSSLSQHHAGASFFDQVPRISPGVTQSATVTAATSPMKPRIGAPQLALSPQKIPMAMTTTPGRARSLTVGSQDGSPVTIGELVPHYKQRRSQVFDMSPSSSDNEGDKANQALLRVQRRRQSSRRLSQINFDGGPMFRPLDVLICEDHPVSRMVMEKLLEKLRCRTITVSDGGEATRVAMGDVKFDIILMEFKLPSVNGADVARMIRSTKNINSTTPIVAITGYLKELQQPHFFDALIEKPPTTTKLTEVLCRFCQWKAPALGQTYPPLPSYPVPSALRQEPLRHDDSPSSLSSSIFAQMPGSSFRGSSRGDSIGSSLFEDSEPMIQDDNIPVIISRKATGDWDEHGLGISEDALLEAHDNDTKGAMAPHLLHQHSAPPALGALASAARARSPARVKAKQGKGTEYAESGDDEDEELGSRLVKSRSPTGKQNRGSKLGTEMMRTNSRGSVISGSELTANEADDEISANELSRTSTALTESPEHTNLLDPDDISPGQPISATPARTGDSHRTVSPGAANASSPLTQRLAELSISTPRPNSLTTPRSPFSGPSPALTPPVEEAEFDLSETPKPKSTHDDETTDEEPTPKASDAGLSRSAGPGLGQFDYLSKGEPSLR